MTASVCCPPWSWLRGNGQFLPLGPSFLSLPRGVCGNVQPPGVSRSKVYSPAASGAAGGGGRPAHGNKSELILSCSSRVLLSTADLQATAHLRTSGREEGGPTVSPLPISMHWGTQQPLWQGVLVGLGNQRQGHWSLCLVSVAATDAVCGVWPAPCFLCAQVAICRRQVIKAVISLNTVINPLEKAPIQLLLQLRNGELPGRLSRSISRL